MSNSAKQIIALLLTIVCGICVVTLETFHNFELLLIWFVALLATVSSLRRQRQGRRALYVAGLHGLTMVAIITVAALAPGKQIDVVKQRAILLPTTKLTVAQLAEFCRDNRKSLPLRIYIPSKGAAVTSELQFTSRHLPVSVFMDQIEQQTGLHGRICGCGNAYTILTGAAYNGGLSFMPKDGSPYQW